MTARLFAGAALAAVLFGGNVQAADPLKSGPPVGDQNDRRGFRPQFVAGPSQPRCPV
jgi:hypothetical protein